MSSLISIRWSRVANRAVLGLLIAAARVAKPKSRLLTTKTRCNLCFWVLLFVFDPKNGLSSLIWPTNRLFVRQDDKNNAMQCIALHKTKESSGANNRIVLNGASMSLPSRYARIIGSQSQLAVCMIRVDTQTGRANWPAEQTRPNWTLIFMIVFGSSQSC